MYLYFVSNTRYLISATSISDILGLYFMRNGLTKANGINVVIEDRDKSPSILSNGISVQPGAETNIGLKKTTISRLKAPFDSDCKSRYLMEEFKQNSFLTLFEYSSKNCKSWCYIEKILEECNCFDHTLMDGVMVEEFLNAKQKYNFTLCDTTSGSHHGSDCVNKVLFTVDQEALIGDCFCGSECKETEYRVFVSLHLLQKTINLKICGLLCGKGKIFLYIFRLKYQPPAGRQMDIGPSYWTNTILQSIIGLLTTMNTLTM